MTTRQTIEIVLLAIVCIASLRASFWKGEGLTPPKKLGLLLFVIVFISIALFILKS